MNHDNNDHDDARDVWKDEGLNMKQVFGNKAGVIFELSDRELASVECGYRFCVISRDTWRDEHVGRSYDNNSCLIEFDCDSYAEALEQLNGMTDESEAC